MKFPWWPFLSKKFDGFTILIGSNIGSMISSNTCSNVLVWNLTNISVISWSFSKTFLLKISLISTYKMPPHLLSNLLKVPSNLSPNIRKFESSPYWQCTEFPNMQMRQKWCHLPHLHMKTNTKLCVGQAAGMENPIPIDFSKLKYTALLSDNKPNEVASCTYW